MPVRTIPIPREEVANSVTHGFGAVASIVACIFLILPALQTGNPTTAFAFGVYGASLIAVYLASTLYHAVRSERAKAMLRRMDHAAIYIFIAGTYTPITLIVLDEKLPRVLLGSVWVLTIAGVVLKFLFMGRYKRLFLAGYVIMGWTALLMFPQLWNRLPIEAMGWLIGGGLAYTIGVGFFVRERMPFSHAIWHVWVVAGSACHFILLYRYVLPGVV